MAIVRYQHPTSLLGELQNEINQMFGPTFSGNLSGNNQNMGIAEWAPTVDIKEGKNEFKIFADIPGVNPKDIDINFDNHVLTIKGQKETESKTEEKNFSRVERFSGSFFRQFTLPDTADGEKIQAQSKHGVLEITIPKNKKAISHKIEVRDGE